MSTLAERLSIFSVFKLSIQAIRSKIRLIFPIFLVGMVVPLATYNLASWWIGLKGSKAFSSIIDHLPANQSLIEVAKPFALKWFGLNLATEVFTICWMTIAYMMIVRHLLDYFVLKATKPMEILKASIMLFLKKMIPVVLLGSIILALTQMTVILGLYIFFMLMMVPVLAHVRSDGGFKLIWSAIFLGYVKELKISRMEVAFLLMGIGGLTMMAFYGVEFLLMSVKQAEIYWQLPSMLTQAISKSFPLNLLTLVIEVLEPIMGGILLTILAGVTVAAYARIEQESVKREIFGKKAEA